MKPSIEKIFEPLKDAKINAPSHLWNNIQDEMIVHNASQNIQHSGKSPSNKLWHKIQNKLLLHNFLHFSRSTFNIYYFILLLLGIYTGIYLANNKSNTTKTQTKLSKQITIVASRAKTCHKTNDKTSKAYTKQPLITKNDILTSKHAKHKNKVYKTKKTHQTNKHYGDITTHKKGVINYDYNNNNDNITFNTTKTISHKTLSNPIDTFIVYDTITYFDTIKVLQSVPQKDLIFDHGSIGYYSYGGFLMSSVSSSTEANGKLAEQNDKATTAQGMYAVMIEGKLKIAKKLYFGTGIGFSQYFEKFEYKYTEQKVDTHYVYHQYETTNYMYSQHNYIKYDTNRTTYTLTYSSDSSEVLDTVWNYQIDTIIFSVTDSTLITQKDSQLVAVIDTTKETEFYHYINHYSYVQIPIFFTYSYKINSNWDINLTGGVIANLLVNAKGYGISLGDIYQPVALNELPLLKMYFNYCGSIGASYHLNKHFSLNTDLYYGGTIGNIFKNTYELNKKFNFAGLKAGISYGF